MGWCEYGSENLRHRLRRLDGVAFDVGCNLQFCVDINRLLASTADGGAARDYTAAVNEFATLYANDRFDYPCQHTLKNMAKIVFNALHVVKELIIFTPLTHHMA